MRRALVGLLALVGCAEAPEEPEPEPWPVAVELPEAAAPDLVVRWQDLVALRWPATITRASGIGVEEPCFIDALTDGPRFRRVVVQCGARTLYDSDRSRYGGPVEGATLRERVSADAIVHGLAIDHTAGDVHAMIATNDEVAIIEETSWLGWSVQLAPVAWTEGRPAPALLVPSTAEAALSFVATEDNAISCTADIRAKEAFGEALRCSIAIACDEREVFTSTTMGPCTVEGGSVASAEIPSEVGPPAFAWTAVSEKATLVLDGRRLHLEDGLGRIGIAECDEYIALMQRCMRKAPEATREPLQQAFERTVEVWREAAAGPGKSVLPMGCQAAVDAVKHGLSSWGCT